MFEKVEYIGVKRYKASIKLFKINVNVYSKLMYASLQLRMLYDNEKIKDKDFETVYKKAKQLVFVTYKIPFYIKPFLTESKIMVLYLAIRNNIIPDFFSILKDDMFEGVVNKDNKENKENENDNNEDRKGSDMLMNIIIENHTMIEKCNINFILYKWLIERNKIDNNRYESTILNKMVVSYTQCSDNDRKNIDSIIESLKPDSDNNKSKSKPKKDPFKNVDIEAISKSIFG